MQQSLMIAAVRINGGWPLDLLVSGRVSRLYLFYVRMYISAIKDKIKI